MYLPLVVHNGVTDEFTLYVQYPVVQFLSLKINIILIGRIRPCCAHFSTFIFLKKLPEQNKLINLIKVWIDSFFAQS
jgi:hypothetical protein